jgi:hypothetical protein
MVHEWLNASASFDDGTRKIYSVREQAPAGAGPDTFSTVVVIEWTFEDQLPDAHLRQEMDVLEELLEPLDDTAAGSFLVHIITGDGLREWCYYTRDYPAFRAALNRLTAGQRHFPIELEYQEHTDWSYWEEIRDFVQNDLGDA